MFRRLRNSFSFLMAAAVAGVSAPAIAETGHEVALPKNLTQQYLLEKYAKPGSDFAYLNHTMVHYRDEGDGPAVLLIHGSNQDVYDWDAWEKELVKKYRVVRFDRPGSGLTGPVSTKDYSIDDTMRTVDALMEKLGIQRFAVVGTSLGGVIAFRYASTRQDRVAALVLMNSAGVEYGNSKILPPQPRRYNNYLSDTISYGQGKTQLQALFVDPAKVRPSRIDRMLDYQRRLHRQEEADAIVASYDRGDPAVVLGRIKAPVLVLWGGASRALATTVADKFVSMLTSASVVEKVVVPGAGHWMHVEAPMQSLPPAEDFLDRCFARRLESGKTTCKFGN